MKASELVKGESYGTVWGNKLEFVGTEYVSAHYEEFDAQRGSTMYVFKDGGGKMYMHSDEVEKFVSNGTVEISSDRLGQIMKGVEQRDGQINEALRKVNAIIGKIEDMKLDCEGEVYDELCKVADILSR